MKWTDMVAMVIVSVIVFLMFNSMINCARHELELQYNCTKVTK